ncbi:hypothetical protein RI129_009185 [Pyrocoelia pectoralis]|uniref:Endonuclease-reverse transcriptase n=1 Tax=Pyrocoelia pectoralis TaxID=417401 RepID=A0AAN7VA03_9COLE
MKLVVGLPSPIPSEYRIDTEALFHTCQQQPKKNRTECNQEEERLRRWERRMLRAIYGGIKTEECWRRRTNQEIEELYERPDIIACVKAQRIGWLGHLERIDAVRLPKMIIYRRPIGKKRKGRPRKRWMNEVEKDLRDMKLGSWKETARNRGEWKKIVKEALKRRW